MFDTYRAVFRTPGTAAFCVAGMIMRLPIAMYPIGLVLIVSARSGRYGFAGILTAVYVIANGAGNPALARVSDRMGQRRLLLAASVVHAAAAVLLALCFTANWPDWTLLGPTIVCGFAFLSVGSLVRARWSYVLAGRPELATAYSLESALDEVVFVVGPLVATVLATQLDPVVVLYLAAALVLGGAIWLSAQTASEPPAQRSESPRERSAIREPGVLMLTAFAAAMGMIFASTEVTVVAFCGQHHQRGWSGTVLACFALGSAIAGFLYGARRTWAMDLLDRYRLQAFVLGALPLLFLAAVNVGTLAVIIVFVGAGVAPALITAFGLVERIVPGGSLTEGLAWIVTGLSIGYGAGASLVGHIADALDARSAFVVTIAAGALTAAIGAILHTRLRTMTSVAAPVLSESAR